MSLNPEAMDPEKGKKRVLFLCNENSCRSQMAEGFLRALAGETFEAYSAGTTVSSVHPLAIEVMKEVDVDISRQWSKQVSDFDACDFDFVITVCEESARNPCPVFAGGAGTRLSWDIEDPASASGATSTSMKHFRKARDQVGAELRRFIKENTC